jgi:hypothetical protein
LSDAKRTSEYVPLNMRSTGGTKRLLRSRVRFASSDSPPEKDIVNGCAFEPT